MLMPTAFMLGWLLGLASLHQLAQLPPSPWPWLMLAGCGLLAPALLLRRLPVGGRVALLLALGTLAGLGSGCLRAEQRLQARMGPALEGQELEVQAEVMGLPQAVQGFAGNAGWRLVLGLEALPGQVLPAGVPEQVLALGYPVAGQPPWRACERWRLRLRLQRSPGLANPHGFDQALWMLEQGLQARAQIRPGPQQRLAGATWHCLSHWREAWRERLQARLGHGGASGLLTALSVGDQSAIPAPDWQVCRDAGVAHLVAISGLHITMFAWGVSALATALWRRSEVLCLACPAPRAGAWLGVLAATAYAAFAGWGVPAQRTVWMLLGLVWMQQGAWRWPWPLRLLTAAWVVCLLDPWALCQAGFWLSFGAVALLMSQGDAVPRQGWRARLGALLREQGIVTLGLAPLTLILFQQLSLVGLLSNLLAIPLVSFVITPLALAGGVLPLLWEAGAWLGSHWLSMMGTMANWPMAVLSLPVAPAWAQAAALVGAALLVAPLPRSLRLAGLPLLPGLLWPLVPHPSAGRFELLAADVGQGAAVLVRTERHLLLYDAGPRWGSGADAGQRVLLPLMRALGWLPLDQLMLSHPDLDHVGGAAAVLRQLRPALVRSSLPPGHALLQGLLHTPCERGQRWVWDGVRFEVLHPGPAALVPPRSLAAARPNHRSCVLRITDAQGHSALLTGDVEAPDEVQMLAQGQVLPSEVLLLPHHGSRTSSTQAFLDAVAPRLALAQAGYRNRFGHPHPDVLARYRAAGIPVWQTAGCGAWRWRSGEVWPSCERQRDPRYWQVRDLVAQPAPGEEPDLPDP
ncbi:DNA internalization-related competence protein ComEC/Rec2 [Roseateles sp. DB2]|uniref:DNA internalization-related competence protein ComEC/Rec2 n=1 Tax=Roseateles sp. DB2 TaxID=3453717 RepID=UPI003EEA60D4